MTRNQLEYLGLQETKRNNVATLSETYRHNVVGEKENNRHNLVTESVSKGTLKETKRHNLKSEKLSSKQINASIKNAQTSAAAQKYSADTAAQANKYAAETNAAAHKYAADASAAASKYVAQVNSATQKAVAARNNKTKVAVQDSVNETNKFLKAIDEMIALKNLDQKDKLALQQIRKDLAIANRELKLKEQQTQINAVLKLIDSATSLINNINPLKGLMK